MYTVSQEPQEVNTATLEKLQSVDALCKALLDGSPFSPVAVAQAFDVAFYGGGLEDALSLKPRIVKLTFIVLENEHGYACGVAEPQNPVQLLPFVFLSGERAVLFSLLSWRYRDMLLLATSGVAGNG